MKPDASLKGKFLLDSGKLAGSFFEKTVIFICQHDSNGAIGFVLNRPTGTQLGDAVEADLPDSVELLQLHLGGPVQTDVLSYLHADSSLIQTNIVPGIEFGHSVTELVELLSGFSPGRELKVFGGYSGWGEGQLDGEIESGAWFVHESSLENIFRMPANRMWSAMLSEMGPEYRLIAQAPDDPSLN